MQAANAKTRQKHYHVTCVNGVEYLYMSAVELKANNHVGILFQPRSGSHVVRSFLSDMANLLNIGEFLNSSIVHLKFDIEDGDLKFMDTPNRGNWVPDLSPAEKKIILNNNLNILQKMSDNNKYSVFGMPIGYHMEFYPDLSKILASRQDIQWVYLLRADVLYSMISAAVSYETDIWHNNSSRPIIRQIDPFPILVDKLEEELNRYIKAMQDIDQKFKVDVLYYEEFQFNVNILRNRFTGFPKRIASIHYSKFQGNHKDFISNIDEIEDFYEQFVNEHKEYFPQYFSKLPGVIIPACQGRQPRDLSLKLSAATA